ncbi:helix-turn-helix domain-containing protein [Paenibacillus mesotrionivorans]|uniref:Helix-turn-helix domain-containing protein n=1 Tax=Paenibacillus mesotrionivorans TaxID=3160968 RepID=A0ACC7NUQ3_9BACL
MVNIISIVPNECLPAGRTLQFFITDTDFVYIETLNSLRVIWGKCHARLDVGDCVLTQRLDLHNCGPNPTFIRVVKLHIDTKISFSHTPFISQFYPIKGALLRDLFSPLFQDYSRITEIEKMASQLLEQWSAPPSQELIHSQPKPHGSIDARLIKVNRYLRHHCEEIITLQQLAEFTKCNPVYLSNVYSKVFQISPMKHLQKMKMDKAKILLETTNMSIKEISNRLGYVSASQFSDLFKRHNGITPLLFKKIRG